MEINNEKDNLFIITIFDNHCVTWEEMNGNLSVKDFKTMLVKKYILPDNIVFEIRERVLPIRKNIMLKELDKRKIKCIEIHVFTQEGITKLIERS